MLEARADSLKAELKEVSSGIDRLDGETIKVRLELAGDIQGDLDQVNAKLRQLDSASKTAVGGLQGVAHRGGQARSALGNMVGNSAQDIANLSGVTGTAGVAISQLTEYAADGSISLKQMATAGLAMAGIGAAAVVAAHGIQEIQRESKATTAEVKSMVDGLRDGEAAAAQFRGQLEDTGQLRLTTILGDTVDVTSDLARAGLTAKQYGDTIAAGVPAVLQMRDALAAQGVPLEVIFRLTTTGATAARNYSSALADTKDITKALALETRTAAEAQYGFEARAAGIGGKLSAQAVEAAHADASITKYTGSLDQFSSVGATFGAQITPALGDMSNAFTKAQTAAREAYDAINLVFDQDPASVESAVAGLQQYHSDLFGLQTIAGASATALDGMSDSLKANGESFDVSTEAGRANQQALEALAGSTIPTIAANYDAAGGSFENFAMRQHAANATLRQSLIDAGASATAATEIANKLMPLDGLEMETQWKLLIEQDAQARLDAILPMLDALNLAPDIEKKIALMILDGASPQDILNEIDAGLGDDPVTKETELLPPPAMVFEWPGEPVKVPTILEPPTIAEGQSANDSILGATLGANWGTITIPTEFGQPAPPETGWTSAVPTDTRVPAGFDDPAPPPSGWTSSLPTDLSVPVVVTTPGADTAAQVLSAVALAGQSIPPTKSTAVSAPGAGEAKSQTDGFWQATARLFPTKSTAVSAPGAPVAKSQTDSFWQATARLFPSRNTQIGAPGAPVAKSQTDGFWQSTARLFPSKQTNISAPGASEAAGQAGAVSSAVAGIPSSKTVWIYVKTSGLANVGDYGLAGGGPVSQVPGTGQQRVALVGEEGPELVSLPVGAYVHTAPQTRRLMAQATVPAFRTGGYVYEDETPLWGPGGVRMTDFAGGAGWTAARYGNGYIFHPRGYWVKNGRRTGDNTNIPRGDDLEYDRRTKRHYLPGWRSGQYADPRIRAGSSGGGGGAGGRSRPMFRSWAERVAWERGDKNWRSAGSSTAGGRRTSLAGFYGPAWDDTPADVRGRRMGLSRPVFANWAERVAHYARYAAGTNWHPGGAAWVGESGPELVDLPVGSSVTNAAASRQRVAGGGAATVQLVVEGNIYGDAALLGMIDRELDKAARKVHEAAVGGTRHPT